MRGVQRRSVEGSIDLPRVGESPFDLPYVVIARSQNASDCYLSGPYPNVLVALTASEVEQQFDLDPDGVSHYTFHVQPLYPPLQSGTARRVVCPQHKRGWRDLAARLLPAQSIRLPHRRRTVAP